MPSEVIILFLAADPSDTTRLRLDEESRLVDARIQQAEFRAFFRLEKHYAVRVSDLASLLLRHRPAIVHFACHGTEYSELILVDDDGLSKPVAAPALSRLFGAMRRHVRCVVLNACYSEDQAAAIGRNIDYVVGMTAAIGDEAALAFSPAFYQALAYGESVPAAFELACAEIELAGMGGSEKPQLRARESNLEPLVFAPATSRGGEQAAAQAGAQSVSVIADPTNDKVQGGPQFATTVQGGTVGQVISVDTLQGGLTINS
jgi:hypothetical protein